MVRSFLFSCSLASLPLHALRLANPENQFRRTDFPVFESAQPLLHAPQPAGHDLIRHRLEPALLQSPTKEPKHHIRELLIAQPTPGFLLPGVHIRVFMGAAYEGHGMGDGGGDVAVVLVREDDCDVPPLAVQHLADVLVGVVFADAVECVFDFAAWDFGNGGAEGLDELRVAGAVVEDEVAFGGVDEGFDVRDAFAGDAD